MSDIQYLSLIDCTKHNALEVAPNCCKWYTSFFFMAEYYSLVHIPLATHLLVGTWTAPVPWLL